MSRWNTSGLPSVSVTDVNSESDEYTARNMKLKNPCLTNKVTAINSRLTVPNADTQTQSKSFTSRFSAESRDSVPEISVLSLAIVRCAV